MRFQQQLKELVSSTQIEDWDAYRIAGKHYTVFHQQAFMEYTGLATDFGDNQLTEPETRYQHLIQHLTNTLYCVFYCGSDVETATRTLPLASERVEFMQELSANNAGSQAVDSGWSIYHIDEQSGIHAQKNGRLRQAIPGSYVMTNPTEQPAVGKTINFFRQKENTQAQKVFYFANSDAWFDRHVSQMRVYFNIEPEGALHLVRLVTTILNQFSVPFSFKCLNHKSLYERSDSAVLYFDKTHFDFVLKLLNLYVLPEISFYLKEDVPLFCDKITAGVGLAADPGNGQSFGMSRCSWIAIALVKAFKDGITSEQARLYEVVSFLGRRGIDLDHMHLNPQTIRFSLSSQFIEPLLDEPEVCNG